jgi:hypothetical protein
MSSYLNEKSSSYLNETNNFEIERNFKPISNVKKETWSNIDDKFKKVFSFKEIKFVEQFIVQIIKYNRETTANIEFRCREYEVGIILHPLSGQISEIEIEASKDIDKIKKDVMYYYAK